MRGSDCVCVCVWVRGDACVRTCMCGYACDVCISVSASSGLSKDTKLLLQIGLVRPPQNELYSGKLVRLACGARVCVGGGWTTTCEGNTKSTWRGDPMAGSTSRKDSSSSGPVTSRPDEVQTRVMPGECVLYRICSL